MNAFQIPERSAFAGDPSFARPIQQHRGTPVHIEHKAPKPRKAVAQHLHRKRSSVGNPGGRPRSIFLDAHALYLYRQAGHTWKECAEKFKCSWEYARASTLKLYPETARFINGRDTNPMKRRDVATPDVVALYAQLKNYRKVAEHFGMSLCAIHVRINGRKKRMR